MNSEYSSVEEEDTTTDLNCFVSSTQRSKLQPWQENLLRWYMEEPEAQTRLVMYGRQCGKSMLQLEYMKLIGKHMEDQQDQSET